MGAQFTFARLVLVVRGEHGAVRVRNLDKHTGESPMKKVVAIASMFALLSGVMAVAPQAVKAERPHSNPLVMPVTAPGGAFTGTFTLSSFALKNGSLVANGILSGTDANGIGHFAIVSLPVSTGSKAAGAAVAAAPAACPILHLVLGPISLDVLGLSVTTNTIVLDITAIPGAGNLLGNLLCDVANLLNTNPTTTLVALLNQIIAILQGL